MCEKATNRTDMSDRTPTSSEASSTDRILFHWWHALMILAIANVVSALPVGYGGDKVFYNNFIQPQFSPPDWLFAPMWLFLNITSLIALSLVANAAERSTRRQICLILEGIGWVLFAIFTTLYFLMHSPILGAVDTVAGLAVGLGSLACCIGIDRRAAVLILLRVLWLGVASYVSVSVALHNADEFFQGLGN
jgi:translocator protein